MDWISVEERMPEELEQVLFWHTWGGASYVVTGRRYGDELRIIGSNNDYRDTITHWMPLPDGPIAADRGKKE